MGVIDTEVCVLWISYYLVDIFDNIEGLPILSVIYIDMYLNTWSGLSGPVNVFSIPQMCRIDVNGKAERESDAHRDDGRYSGRYDENPGLSSHEIHPGGHKDAAGDHAYAWNIHLAVIN